MPHFPDLYRTARLLAQDSTEAEDLVQEVYLEAWKSFHRFQTGTNCRAWLFKILFHRLHHFRRRWAKAAKVEAFENPEDQDSHKQYWFRIMPLRPDFQRSLTANPKWFTLTCTRVTVDVVRPVTSTDHAPLGNYATWVLRRIRNEKRPFTPQPVKSAASRDRSGVRITPGLP